MLGIEGSFLHHFRKKVEPFIDPASKPGSNAQCSEIMHKVSLFNSANHGHALLRDRPPLSLLLFWSHNINALRCDDPAVRLINNTDSSGLAAADNDVGFAESQPNEFGHVALRSSDQRRYNRGGR